MDKQLADTLFRRYCFLHELQSIATSTVQPFVAEYLITDNDDVKDDDNDANNKDVELVEIATGETLTMLGRLVNLKYLSMEERNSLVPMKFKLEKIRVLNKKQIHFCDYFMLE